MERHQRDAGLGGVGVGVGDERGVVEEFGERLAALLRVLRGVGEFLQVLDAGEGFGRGFFFEGADVAGAVVEELDELGEGGGIAGLAEAFSSAASVADESSLCIRISAARSGVVLAERLRTTGAKGLKLEPMAWAASVSVRSRRRWWRSLRWGRSRSRS